MPGLSGHYFYIAPAFIRLTIGKIHPEKAIRNCVFRLDMSYSFFFFFSVFFKNLLQKPKIEIHATTDKLY